MIVVHEVLILILVLILKLIAEKLLLIGLFLIFGRFLKVILMTSVMRTLRGVAIAMKRRTLVLILAIMMRKTTMHDDERRIAGEK